MYQLPITNDSSILRQCWIVHTHTPREREELGVRGEEEGKVFNILIVMGIYIGFVPMTN